MAVTSVMLFYDYLLTLKDEVSKILATLSYVLILMLMKDKRANASPVS